MKSFINFVGSLVFLATPTAFSQTMDLSTCEQMVVSLKKQFPIQIDAVTQRVNAVCARGWTKPALVQIFDEVKSEQSAEIWIQALSDPAKNKILIRNQCQPNGFGKMIKIADVGYNLKINGVDMGQFRITEKICSSLSDK
jgi:glucan phosphorylase